MPKVTLEVDVQSKGVVSKFKEIISGLDGMQKQVEKLGKKNKKDKFFSKVSAENIQKMGASIKTLTKDIEDQGKKMRALGSDPKGLAAAQKSLEDMDIKAVQLIVALEDLKKRGFDVAQVEEWAGELQSAVVKAGDMRDELDHLAEGFGEIKGASAGIWSALKSGSPFKALSATSKGVKTTTSALSQMGGALGGSAVPGMSALGGAATALAPVLSGLAIPLAVIAAILATVFAALTATVAGFYALAKAEETIKALNSELLNMATASDIVDANFKSSALPDFTKGVYSLDKAMANLRGTMYDYGRITEFKEGLKGITKSGIKIGVLQSQVGGLTESISVSADYSRIWGVNVEDTGEILGDWTANLGKSVESVRGGFSKITRDAAASGMSTQRYIQVIKQVSQNMGVMTSRVEGVSAVFSGLKKAGLTVREAEKAVTDFSGALTNMSSDQVARLAGFTNMQNKAIEAQKDAVDELQKSWEGAGEALKPRFKETLDRIRDLKPQKSFIDLMEIMEHMSLGKKIEIAMGVTGNKKGLEGLADINIAMLGALAKATNIDFQTLRAIQATVRADKKNGINTKESIDLQEKKMKEDRDAADKILAVKEDIFEKLGIAADLLTMMFWEIGASLMDMGVFKVLHDIIKKFVDSVKTYLKSKEFEELYKSLGRLKDQLVKLVDEFFKNTDFEALWKSVGSKVSTFVDQVDLLMVAFNEFMDWLYWWMGKDKPKTRQEKEQYARDEYRHQEYLKDPGKRFREEAENAKKPMQLMERDPSKYTPEERERIKELLGGDPFKSLVPTMGPVPTSDLEKAGAVGGSVNKTSYVHIEVHRGDPEVIAAVVRKVNHDEQVSNLA